MLKLYYANINQIDGEKFHILFEKVNMQRREKILRCKNEKDKHRSLLAGYLLRIALEQENVEYDKVCFSVAENGKPVIQNFPTMCYSLSHAGDYAVCAVSDRSVGVDIETKSKMLFEKEEKLEAVAKKILSEDEYATFVECPNENRAEMFLQYWTRKEAYSKADGRGLGIGLNLVQTEDKMYFSKWLEEETYLSVYVEDEDYTDLQIEKINV